jgi:hypothetical protein
MILNLLKELTVRGVVFERGCLILLRRRNKNNFIFLTKRFDSIHEIITKYRFNCILVKDLISFVDDNFGCDIIEFVIDSVSSRAVLKINFYEVKTRRFDAKRKYFETCLSNYEFMTNSSSSGIFLISCVLFKNWDFSFNVYDYADVLIRVYNSVENKTVFFSRPKNKFFHLIRILYCRHLYCFTN